MSIKKLAVYIVFVFLLNGREVFSQDTVKIDSLVKLLSQSKDDTNKVRLLMAISRQYNGNDEKQVYNYLHQAFILATNLDYKSGAAKALSQTGTHYFRTGQYIEAITTSVKAAVIFDQIGDENGIASAYSNIGNVYFELEEYEKALNCQIYALKIQKKLKSERAMGNTMIIIGNIFQKQGNMDTAQYYFESALGIQKNLKSELGIAKTYDCLGALCEARNDSSKALEYFLMSEKIYEKKLNKRGLAITFCNIGNVYLGNKSYSLAVEYYRKSMALAEMAEAQETIEDVYSGLAEAYEKMGRFAEALKYYKLYNECEDSVFDVSRQKLMDMQYKLESEKNESLIKLQQTELINSQLEIEKRNARVYAMALGVLLLLALSILSYTGYKRKKRDHDLIVIEKKRSEDLLLNILPEEVAEELKQNGKSQAKKIDLVTVLFADFVGFSKFAEMVDAEKVVQVLDHYFQAFDVILNKYDIEKIKTMGDAYMCAGGVPGINSSNPLDVVNCGIEMRDFVEKYKNERKAANKHYLEMRIGIHTGPVVAGIVGVKKFSYDIWGDTVNIASRLQSTGQEGKVNISEATYQCVKDRFKCEYRGKVPAKNIGDIEMYFVEPLL
jgi:adenylate cyclase